MVQWLSIGDYWISRNWEKAFNYFASGQWFEVCEEKKNINSSETSHGEVDFAAVDSETVTGSNLRVVLLLGKIFLVHSVEYSSGKVWLSKCCDLFCLLWQKVIWQPMMSMV